MALGLCLAFTGAVRHDTLWHLTCLAVICIEWYGAMCRYNLATIVRALVPDSMLCPLTGNDVQHLVVSVSLDTVHPADAIAGLFGGAYLFGSSTVLLLNCTGLITCLLPDALARYAT